MRVAIIGAGAMGSAFGVRFALAGHSLVMIDRAVDRVAAIAADGLIVEAPDGRLTAAAVATTEIGAAAQTDLVLVLVDSGATSVIATALRTVLPASTPVLTLQNGIGNVEALAEALGAHRIVAGSTYNSAAVVAPGLVRHSNIGETTIGTIDDRAGPALAAATDLMRASGLPFTVDPAVMGHVWMKFVLNAAINPVCAVTGLRPGEVARTRSALTLMERLLDEILAVVAAEGIRLPSPDPRAEVIDHAYERYNRPSMLQHVDQGRRTEIEALNGALVDHARRHAVPCPFNEAILLTVRSIEARIEARRDGSPLDEAALEAAARVTPRPRP
ncbi:MAG: ketopantoate reductase family protein [Labrys sp. (in: a-proteobacteria)]